MSQRRGLGLLSMGLLSMGVLSLGLLMSAGCDGLLRVASPEVPLWVNHPGSAMALSRSRDLSAETRRVGEAYERGKPEIDPAHLRVFVGSSDHGLYAINTADLTTAWRFETAGAVQCEPLYVLDEDVVYFGSNDGALYKLRAADGKMVWRFSSNAEITRAPLIHDGVLYAVNANDTLLAIDPATGEMRWYRHRQPAAGMEISGYAGPAAWGERVYTAFSDGVVMAYRTDDGAEAWPALVDLAADAEQMKEGEDLRYLDVDTTPVVAMVGDTQAVIVASYEGGVYALDALSGATLWANHAITGAHELILWSGRVRGQSDRPAAKSEGVQGAATPPRERRVLVASSGLTGIWGISLDDGAELWRRDLPTGGVTAVEPWSGALLVGTTRYGMFLLNPLDGGVLDGLHNGGAFAATPAAYGRHAFVLSNEGVLFHMTIVPPVADPPAG